MSTTSDVPQTAAETLLRALNQQGVDYLFANPGTDFPPVIEAFAKNLESNALLPRPVLVPHENAAVAMAHGVYLVTGRPQAVMVHVTVGTGNTINALMDAARDFVPVILMAGRSPITERGPHGTRSNNIHWAQEMFDQAGMLRELVKWDYELRRPDQVQEVVTRAVELAMTSPRGPVYLALPREVLAGAAPEADGAPFRRARPEAPHAGPAAIARLAEWIAAAERPLIVTSGVGRSPAAVAALAGLAERHAVPVVNAAPRYMNLPASHAMHLGFQAGPLVAEADLVLVLDCDVPWIPSQVAPPAGCRVVHLGEDPTYHRYPMRSFPSDLAVTAAPETALPALDAALTQLVRADDRRLAARRARVAEQRAAMRARWAAEGEAAGRQGHITPEWISRCVGEAVGEDAIIVNEYPLRPEHCPRERPGTFFGPSPAGGLGWGLPAALGAKLGAPDRLVCATLGDGSYMFANPSACHWASAQHGLPILAVVFNNELYGAVRSATLGMYRTGAAAKGEGRFLATLGNTAYEKMAEANGGFGIAVDRPADLPAALARAVQVVRTEKRQALVNVVCKY